MTTGETSIDKVLTPPAATDPGSLFDRFGRWAVDRGISLYPHQEEALLEIVSDANVIVATPTGSGKTLVAVAALFAGLSTGRRAYYTAPIKALVSERFFELTDMFGAGNVGMITGDSSVNSSAPIICCTAEILASVALRGGAAGATRAGGSPEGSLEPGIGEGRSVAAEQSPTAAFGNADPGIVVMDEFHYYGDRQRGWAWQVPLLELPRAQFILMSATLGDVRVFVKEL